MDIYSKEGLEDLERRLDGIVLTSVDTTTEVADKDLPPAEAVLINAPETLEDAVQRLLQVEMLLEDLSRAVEIAEITGQLNLVEGFRREADEYLVGKVQIQQPEIGDLNLTVIEGEISEETVKGINDKYAKTQ